MRFLTIILISMSFITIACQNSEDTINNPIDPPDNTEPARISIDNRTYEFTADLWQNLMPGPDPSEHQMIASLTVTAEDEQPLPEELYLEYLWIISGVNEWQAELTEIVPDTEPYVQSRNARGGPLWKTDSLATVIIKVNTPDSIYHVQIDNVKIEKAY